MKQQWKKLICCLTCVALLTGCAATGLQRNGAETAEAAAQQTKQYDTPETLISSAAEGKEETVFVLTDANGAVKNIIVSGRQRDDL